MARRRILSLSPDSERASVYPMFLAAIYSVFGHNLSISDARFRIPAVPFMSILAGYGLVSVNLNKKSEGISKKQDNDL